MTGPRHHRLRRDGIEVVVELTAGLPAVVYWGGDLGPDADVAATVAALRPPLARATLDVEPPTTVLPLASVGFAGSPGLLAHRPGSTGPVPTADARLESIDHADDQWLATVTDLAEAALAVRIELELAAGPVLTVAVEVTNRGNGPCGLDAVLPTLPVPGHAAEVMGFTGRWCGEFELVRTPWPAGGTTVAENRRGRTSHDHVPAIVAGSAGFSEQQGEVWLVHLAWSGNHVVRAECLPDGRRHLQVGELLDPGEVVLAPGETYRSPTLVAAHGDAGLTPTSRALHRHQRSRPGHPGVDRPRPVLLNTWEAVYFDHDVETLCALADRAAAVGVERFVLDDGWFHRRRDDTAGLGDWWVDPAVYPRGLHPLADHVVGLGMEFGLWVEPEMVNRASDLYEAHPDWVLGNPGVEGRHQLVLDLARPEVGHYLLQRLDALLAEYPISYLKWDMNRDLVGGSAHAQTMALYGLLDELLARHPGVEIESCASGGGRADLGILGRASRIWTSDNNDALDRQHIQRGCSLLFPPEVMGAHIGPTRSHTTGRRHTLAFRAASALFGHLGIEWNLLGLGDDELADVAEVVALHRRFRPLLHGGDVVRVDHPDDSIVAHGVLAVDRSEALVSVAQVASRTATRPTPLRLPDLDPRSRYQVRSVPLPGPVEGWQPAEPAWWTDGITLTGRQLATHGLTVPVLHPESAAILHLTRV